MGAHRQIGVSIWFFWVWMPASPLAFSTFGCFQTFLGGEACWKSAPTCARLRCAATLKRSDTIDSFALILRGYERLHIEREGATLDRKLEANGMNMSYLELNLFNFDAIVPMPYSLM